MKVFVKRLTVLTLTLLMILPMAAFADGEIEYLWPVPTCAYITSKCGEDGHKGIDIATYAENTEIVASRAGIVVEACPTSCTHINNYPDDRCNYGKGNYLKIVHDDGTSATYMHFKYDTIVVNVGDRVEAGDKLGIMGSSGLSTGQHLHFQVNAKDGTLINNNVGILDYVGLPDGFIMPDDYSDYEGELWICDADIGLNVRLDAGTSASKIGVMSKGTVFAVSEKLEKDGFLWGKITKAEGSPGFTDGWCVLDYSVLYNQDSEDTSTDEVTDTDEIPDTDESTDTNTDSAIGGEIETDVSADTDSEPEDKAVIGDANSDGLVNIMDVVEIRLVIISGNTPTVEQLEIMDLNADGIVNILDIALLRQIILK